MGQVNQHNFMFFNGDFIDTSMTTTPISKFNNLAHAAYEGIRSYNTHNGARLFKPKEHILRLLRTCDALGITHDIKVVELIDQTYELLDQNRLRNAYVRVIVAQDSSVLITAKEWNYFSFNHPIRLTISEYERPNPKSMPVDVKVAGLSISSTLASKAAKAKNFDEALLLDMHGHIAQSSTANIFIEKNGKIYTPNLGHIFPGITRSVVFEICKKLNIEIIEKDLSLDNLQQSDSAFLCGTRTEITGIKSIDSFTFPEQWMDTLGATIQRIYINRVLEQENYEVII